MKKNINLYNFLTKFINYNSKLDIKNKYLIVNSWILESNFMIFDSVFLQKKNDIKNKKFKK